MPGYFQQPRKLTCDLNVSDDLQENVDLEGLDAGMLQLSAHAKSSSVMSERVEQRSNAEATLRRSSLEQLLCK